MQMALLNQMILVQYLTGGLGEQTARGGMYNKH